MARRKRLIPFAAPTAEMEGDRDPAPRSRAPIAAAAGDAAAGAALAEVAGELAAARAQGRLAQPLALDLVVVDHLARDRYAAGMDGPGAPDEEMTALMESLSSRGQQMPIEVVALGDGRFGLISGWRRLTALKTLLAQTGEARFGTVLAVLRQPETAAEAYIAMVEENEIRLALSHYERARIAIQAVARGAFKDVRAALRGLYATASRSKRSKIGAFVPIVTALDGVLRYPTALPERLGLQVSKALEEDPDLGPHLAQTLTQARPETAEDEQAVIRVVLADAAKALPAPAQDRGLDQGGDGPAPIRAEAVQKAPVAKVLLIAKPGSITLQGPGVTREFHRALAAWLEAQQGG